jgi:hypothetical protein
MTASFGLRDGAQVASLRCPILRADERRVHEIPDRVDGEPKGSAKLGGPTTRRDDCGESANRETNEEVHREHILKMPCEPLASTEPVAQMIPPQIGPKHLIEQTCWCVDGGSYVEIAYRSVRRTPKNDRRYGSNAGRQGYRKEQPASFALREIDGRRRESSATEQNCCPPIKEQIAIAEGSERFTHDDGVHRD